MVTERQKYHKGHHEWGATKNPVLKLKKQDGQITAEKRDMQGNPVDNNDRLIAEKVSSIDSIPDEYFTTPMVSIELPKLPEWLSQVFGTSGKRIIIKKNILEKNRNNHPELNGADCREILFKALYNANYYGQTQPLSRPQYWIVMHTAKKNHVVVLDVSDNKDDVEIVGWRFSGKRQLEKLRKQAEREDGQLLILTPQKKGAAAGLSTLPPVVPDGKDSMTNSVTQKKGTK